jgi:Fic family protein
MKIEELEAMLPNFTDEVIEYFETDQKEFKATTVQEIFKIVEKRKKAKEISERMKTKDFWLGVHSNIELFKQRVIDEITNVLKADFNKEEKIKYFFKYYDKNIND